VNPDEQKFLGKAVTITRTFIVDYEDETHIASGEYLGRQIWYAKSVHAIELAEDRHKIELRYDGFTIMHPLSCRPNLFDCDYNFAAKDALSVGEVPNGVYYCSVNSEYLLEIEESISIASVQ
jgi:hypothetical protein